MEIKYPFIVILFFLYLIFYLVRSVFFVSELKKELDFGLRIIKKIPFIGYMFPIYGIFEEYPERVIWLFRISCSIFLIFYIVLIILYLRQGVS